MIKCVNNHPEQTVNFLDLTEDVVPYRLMYAMRIRTFGILCIFCVDVYVLMCYHILNKGSTAWTACPALLLVYRTVNLSGSDGAIFLQKSLFLLTVSSK